MNFMKPLKPNSRIKMYNDDTRETYVERRKAENLAQAERSYKINGSHRNIWIFLFQWAMAEEEYGEHWDKIHKEKNT